MGQGRAGSEARRQVSVKAGHFRVGLARVSARSRCPLAGATAEARRRPTRNRSILAVNRSEAARVGTDGFAARQHAVTHHPLRITITDRGANLKGGPVLLVELGNQTGFPCEVLFHGLTVSGMAVVNEEQIVDAFGI